MAKLFEKDIVVIDCRSTKQKINDLKWKIKDKVYDGWTWVVNNQGELIVWASVLLPVVGGIAKTCIKNKNLRKEEQLKEEYCYDRSLGHYWALKRKLSNKEWLEIEERRKNGDRLADILADLRVLK